MISFCLHCKSLNSVLMSQICTVNCTNRTAVYKKYVEVCGSWTTANNHFNQKQYKL